MFSNHLSFANNLNWLIRFYFKGYANFIKQTYRYTLMSSILLLQWPNSVFGQTQSTEVQLSVRAENPAEANVKVQFSMFNFLHVSYTICKGRVGVALLTMVILFTSKFVGYDRVICSKIGAKVKRQIALQVPLYVDVINAQPLK